VIYGRGCFSCFSEYENRLKIALNDMGITDIQLSYLEGNPRASEDLDQLYKRLRVPESMRGEITVVFDDKFLFEGYIPVEIIIDFLTNHMENFTKIVVYRDELRGLYKIMDENGEIIECNINISISECVGKLSTVHVPLTSILLLIVVGGILDGINPCAFAVLMFFVSFLFLSWRSVPIGQARRRILIVGLIYVTAVFLSYLLIGLALIKVIKITSFPHLVAKTGALIVILLGIVNIKDYFFYGRWLSLRISTSQWRRIGKWVHKATIPSAFITGFMVGIFEFPCTGGIYVAILGLLALRTTFIEGLFYLIIYNLAFILPLLVILFLSSNERIVEKMRKRQEHDKRRIRLFLGLIMISLGLFLLFTRYV
jgi:cytochrome c biogenesis protein CcdA